MPYDKYTAERIRTALAEKKIVVAEKKMFGGIAFLYEGKMSIGVLRDKLTVRVVAEKCEAISKMEYVEPMNFTGKPMKEFFYISSDGYDLEEDLNRWIELGIEHAQRKATGKK